MLLENWISSALYWLVIKRKMLKKKLSNIQVLTYKRGHLSLSLLSLAQVLALQCHEPVQVLRKSEKVVVNWLWRLWITLSCNSRNRKQMGSLLSRGFFSQTMNTFPSPICQFVALTTGSLCLLFCYTSLLFRISL